MRKPKIKETKVTVYQASSVELSKRASSNSITMEVRSGEELLGKLIMGRGSVQWWPNGNSANNFKRNWRQFAKLLETQIGK
jgi:hypothetical protein